MPDTPPDTPNPPVSGSLELKVLNVVAGLIKDLGLPAVLALMFFSVFLIFGNSAQKEEFVDKYILLKNVGNEPFPFFAVVLTLFVVLVLQGYFFRKRIELLESEVKRIGKEKSELQAQLLQRPLRSSEEG